MRRKIEEGFKIFCLENCDSLTEDVLNGLKQDYFDEKKGWKVERMPMQIHDILTEYGVIENPGETGSGEACRWVSDKDWIYLVRIEGTLSCEKIKIIFQGIDTIGDIYWNGKLEKKSRDMFLPADISVVSKRENWLAVHIHSPWKWIEKLETPDRYKDKVMPKWAYIRGYYRSYDDYLGFPPYLTRMGIYDDILCLSGSEMIEDLSCWTMYNWEERKGLVEIETRVSGEEATALKAQIFDRDKLLKEKVFRTKGNTGRSCMEIENPVLWEPVGKGEQKLFRLVESSIRDGQVIDRQEKRLGFRLIEKTGDMEFKINKKPIRLWGANLAPLDNKTGCYCRERARRIIKKALEGNMNCLRVWGGGDRLPGEFYDMCDEAGILLWQDFFHDYSMYPDHFEFRQMCRQEAVYQMRRLRHHPSILLWCGSNESVMCRDFSNPGEECIGYCIYDEDYRQVCEKLDPQRYYHMSSPTGGEFANDPREGDTHSYTSNWFVPGGRYPVFLSENMRSYPPAYRSLKRMMREEEIWPEGYTGQMVKGNVFPWPETWRKYTSAESWEKISEVEQFYDADDIFSMLYRFGGSVGKYISDCVGRYRIGRSWEERNEKKRRCKGHLWWKMNTSAPHIYSGLLDYYLEPYIPYYALKRVYQPFQVFVSKEDFLGIWAVNDTTETVEGSIIVKLFHIKENKTKQEIRMDFRAEPDESVFVGDLNNFFQFLMNKHVLYVKAISKTGRVLTERVEYVDIERHIEFPACRLDIRQAGNELIVETDCLARCVELTGEDEGDSFGWDFSDNYFDLIPGQVKRIQVAGHKKGKITAKGYYSQWNSEILYEERR